MREILFRGKRLDNGEWIEGSYFRLGNKDVYILTGKLPIFACSLAYESYQVIPETVGQYTGLTDKNGKKIFEGDIVRYGGTYHQVVFEKRWSNAYFGIMMDGIETWSFSSITSAYRMKVLGNIHDNPELLGGDQK